MSYSALKDQSFLLRRGCPWGRCLVIAEPRSGVLRWSYINHIPHRSDCLSIGVYSRSPYGISVYLTGGKDRAPLPPIRKEIHNRSNIAQIICVRNIYFEGTGPEGLK